MTEYFCKKKKKTRTRSRNSTTKAVRIGLKFSHESRSNSSDRSPSPGARKTSNFDFCFLETNSAIAGDLKSSCNVRSVRNTIRVGSNFLLGMIGARTRLSPNNGLSLVRCENVILRTTSGGGGVGVRPSTRVFTSGSEKSAAHMRVRVALTDIHVCAGKTVRIYIYVE